MKKSLSLLSTLLLLSFTNAQIGVNTDNPKATLDVQKSENTTAFDGIIAPRLTKEDLNSKIYTTEQTGALVYVTSPVLTSEPNATFQVGKIDTEGYYFFDGGVWQKFIIETIASSNSPINAWLTTGNLVNENTYSQTTGKIIPGNFLGTTNDQHLVFKRNNEIIGVIGKQTVSFGRDSFSRKENEANTNSNIIAIGDKALTNNNGGNDNTAIGGLTLTRNTKGINNIAIGYASLSHNTTFSYNTSVGVNSSIYLETGSNNTVMGMAAFRNFKTGSNNVVIGSMALGGEDNGVGNNNNVAIGYQSNNKGGENNTSIGYMSGYNMLPTSSKNIFIGTGASLDPLVEGSNNVMNIGDAIYGAEISKNNNALIGIGVRKPLARLHVGTLAGKETLRVEGLTEAPTGKTYNVLVVDELGNVKKGTTYSPTAGGIITGGSNPRTSQDDLNNKIEELKAKNTDLEQRIAALEAMISQLSNK